MSEPAATADRPATFREVMASREYRAVFAASGLSWFGDYAARAAIIALVYQRTESVAASAAAFAISYLPWLGIGSVLAALVERYSYRKVMVYSDLLRLVLMAMVALPGLPVWGMMLLLFLTALLNPPFDAARAALLPRILHGDRYVVGLAIQKSAGQAACVLGYAVGAGMAAYDARLAVLLNAATFGVSALVVGVAVREHPPIMRPDERTTLIRETADGFGVVFRSPVLRAIAIIVFATVFFSVVPEGLAAGWAATLTEPGPLRGWYQGAIMVAYPVGFVVGSLLISRLVSPSRRLRLIRPFSILAPLSLVPALFDPGIHVIVVMNAACGFAVAAMLPASNGLFVQALPASFRARAFGVMQSGTQLVQGAAVLIAGVFADSFPLPLVVGLWSVLGVIVLVLAGTVWPRAETIADAVAATRARERREAADVAGDPDGVSGPGGATEPGPPAAAGPIVGADPIVGAGVSEPVAPDGQIQPEADPVSGSPISGSPVGSGPVDGAAVPRAVAGHP